jgi:hypothetical protein
MSTHVDLKSDDNSKKVERNLEELWAQWTLFPSSDNSLENMSIKYVFFLLLSLYDADE